MRRAPAALVALAAGLLLAAATPPWGFWIAAPFGIVLLDRALDEAGLPARRRFGRAWLCWAALLFPTLLWMRALTLPGYVIASATYAAFLAAGTVVAPRGVGRYVALPAGIVLAEWIRWRWPFGGVPLSNLAVGQVAGPLAPILRLGGALLLVGVTVTVGLAVAAALASSVFDQALPADAVIIGEVGLGGELRQVAHMPRRLAEAARLGFGRALVPASAPEGPPGVELLRAFTLPEAIELARITAGGGGRRHARTASARPAGVEVLAPAGPV